MGIMILKAVCSEDKKADRRDTRGGERKGKERQEILRALPASP